ncbi:hypothetical protein L228DRAFT_282289 [Xylona heveae TC161]|uniref:F-box domain-containing protein n=1 Tax=Xylona heveae (strain CBS 132557 / TC161) TaxID=1328760 RepID=A0A165HIQ0_XYLHT|nr:hypothetical protein L228DRAFT_282289 [Xylona heveae TC161]KZF23578.1 hypothetical protein L228DRAFT_282289 [Xylona heveae TC161]
MACTVGIKMACSLEQLPFDILFQIASALPLEDFVHLAHVSKRMRLSLLDETLCRRVVKKQIPYAEECNFAQRGMITYERALLRTYGRRESYATARPFSLSTLGYGAVFVYRQGMLAYSTEASIRILSIHVPQSYERVIEISSLCWGAFKQRRLKKGLVKPVHYSDGVLVCLHERSPKSHYVQLLAIDVDTASSEPGKLLLCESVIRCDQYFVRNDSDYLYYGTRTGEGVLSETAEWILSGWSLRGAENPTSDPFQLHNFFGDEMLVSVAFEVYNGYLYGVSNEFPEEDYDPEEAHHSCYHLFRFPLCKLSEDTFEEDYTIWRRNDAEGVILNHWTTISLCPNEETGELMIIETRRESPNIPQYNQRVHFMLPIRWRNTDSKSDTEDIDGSDLEGFYAFPSQSPELIPADTAHPVQTGPAMGTSPGKEKLKFQKLRMRLPRHVHPGDGPSNTPQSVKPDAPFIKGKTAFCTYNPASRAYLDVVNDELPASETSGWRPVPRMRIRVGSRVLAPPKVDRYGILVKPFLHPITKRRLEGMEEGFIDRGIALWPPNEAPDRMFRLLNPSAAVKILETFADERSVVLIIGPPQSLSYKNSIPSSQITLISFDPNICFPGLRSVEWKSKRGGRFGKGKATSQVGRPGKAGPSSEPKGSANYDATNLAAWVADSINTPNATPESEQFKRKRATSETPSDSDYLASPEDFNDILSSDSSDEPNPSSASKKKRKEHHQMTQSLESLDLFQDSTDQRNASSETTEPGATTPGSITPTGDITPTKKTSEYPTAAQRLAVLTWSIPCHVPADHLFDPDGNLVHIDDIPFEFSDASATDYMTCWESSDERHSPANTVTGSHMTRSQDMTDSTGSLSSDVSDTTKSMSELDLNETESCANAESAETNMPKFEERPENESHSPTVPEVFPVAANLNLGGGPSNITDMGDIVGNSGGVPADNIAVGYASASEAEDDLMDEESATPRACTASGPDATPKPARTDKWAPWFSIEDAQYLTCGKSVKFP